MTNTFEKPLSIAELRLKIDQIANALMLPTFVEVGVRDDTTLAAIVNLIEHALENCGVPSDHWPHTPLEARCIVAINATLNTHISGFHFWELLMNRRKHDRLPKSGAAGRNWATTFTTPVPGYVKGNTDTDKEPELADAPVAEVKPAPRATGKMIKGKKNPPANVKPELHVEQTKMSDVFLRFFRREQ